MSDRFQRSYGATYPPGGPLEGHIGPLPPVGDPRIDDLPEDQKLRLFMGMMQDLMPPGGILDQTTGAEGDIRAIVGSLTKPEDKLAAVRKTYPEAQPYGDENIQFTDPASGQQTLVNPPGLDVGDIRGAAPEIAGVGGSALGASLGFAVGGPAASIAGAGYGGQLAREGVRGLTQRAYGTPDTRDFENRLLGAGTEMAFDMGGQALGLGAPAATRAIFGNRARDPFGRTGAEKIGDFETIGAPLSPGAVTGNPNMQVVEAMHRSTPGGVGRFMDTEQAQQEAIRRGVNQQVERLGGLDSQMAAGERTQTGAQAAGRRFGRVQAGRYREADIPEDMVVNDISSTRGLYERLQQANLTGRRSNVLRPILDHLERILRPGRNEPLTFGELRQIRTDMRLLSKGMEANIGNAGDKAQAPLMRALNSSLTADMLRAADQAGYGEEMRAADRFTREFNQGTGPTAGVGRGAGPFLTKVEGAATPEQAYAMATDATKAGATNLMKLRRYLPRQDWDTLRGTVLNRLGQATPGATGAGELAGEGGNWSAATFLTNWSRMSPDAKTVLFHDRDHAGLRAALDRLVRVATDIGAAKRVSGNPSGTARAVVGITGALEAGRQAAQGNIKTAGGMVLAGTLLPFVTSRLMTTPRFVYWLAGARQAAQQGGVNSLGPWVGRLAAIGSAEPALKEDIQRLLQAITGLGQGRSPAAPAAAPQ